MSNLSERNAHIDRLYHIAECANERLEYAEIARQKFANEYDAAIHELESYCGGLDGVLEYIKNSRTGQES